MVTLTKFFPAGKCQRKLLGSADFGAVGLCRGGSADQLGTDIVADAPDHALGLSFCAPGQAQSEHFGDSEADDVNPNATVGHFGDEAMPRSAVGGHQGARPRRRSIYSAPAVGLPPWYRFATNVKGFCRF